MMRKQGGYGSAIVLGLGLAFGGFGSPAFAETAQPVPVQNTAPAADRIGALDQLLGLDGLFEILAEEGSKQGADLEQSMFPGQGGDRWAATVRRIYTLPPIRARFDTVFHRALADNPAMFDAVEGFFGSERGQRIIRLEIEARRAMLDTEVEEAAEVAAERMKEDRDPKLRQIRRLIEAGDMVEQNVASSMTGLLAFNTGLAETAPARLRTPQDVLMEQVRGQERQIRAEIITWLGAYMALAYGPLDEADMDAYAAFLETPEGRHFFAAMVEGFDQALRPVMQDLGHATGVALTGQDI